MITAAILVIGAEILDGSIVDTNSAFIAKQLTREGVNVIEINSIADDIESISHWVKESAKKYSIVITTGGLGPTFDDLTAQAIAKANNVETEINSVALEHIKSHLRSYGTDLQDSHKHQAELPKGAILIHNDHGTALGFQTRMITDKQVALTFSLPGVPHEMKPMLADVIKMIKNEFNINNPFIKTLRFSGAPESIIDDKIKKIGIPESTTCIINASLVEVIVRIRDKNESIANQFADKLISELQEYFYADSDLTIQELLVNILKARGKTISVAESCTGGAITSSLTNIPGVSTTLIGSVIAYSNEVKMNTLNVRRETLQEFGAVSQQCATEMVEGILLKFNSDYAISTTGIAGPTGGSIEKPVGTVFIGIKSRDRTIIKKFQFRGERNTIKERAALKAMQELYIMIKNEK